MAQIQEAEAMLPKILNIWLCNVQFFQESEFSKYWEKRFGYPYPYLVPVWKQILDIRIRLHTHYPTGYPTELALGPGCRSRLRQDSKFFFRIRIRSKKFVKNRTRNPSHFSISPVAEVICWIKTWVHYGWIDDCSWRLNRSRIPKFEKLPNPDPHPDSKFLEREWSRRLKKWLQPPLIPTGYPTGTPVSSEISDLLTYYCLSVILLVRIKE